MITDNTAASNLISGTTIDASRMPYVEPQVVSAVAEQLFSKLQDKKGFGELGAMAQAMDVKALTTQVIQKLETQMSTMSDEDMAKVMSLGMQIMLQFKNPKPNIGKITKEIFEVLKLLKIDVTSALFEINESMRQVDPNSGSMYDLMQGYMQRAREAESTVHFTLKQQFLGFVSNTINETHRLYRRQFN